jgi:hypothetical protein
MNIFTRLRSFGWLAIVLIIATALMGCGNNKVEAQSAPPPSLMPVPALPAQPMALPPTTDQPTIEPIVAPTPTLYVPQLLIDPSVDLWAGPVYVPLEIEIPALDVNAPILSVGLTPKNVMDSPKGPIGDPVWHTAFWYRGGGIPGDVGTATIAAHVNDPLGDPEIFAHLEDLQPGDAIIIHAVNSDIDIHFTVNQVLAYSVKQSSDPDVLKFIYGAGPVSGTGPQPSPDGLSHLTLITCAGYIVDGEFDHHTVVFATRSEDNLP